MVFGNKNKDSSNPPSEKDEQPAKDPGLADPTFPLGEQSVDPKLSKALPDSSPDEIAPIPDGSEEGPRKARQAASATGYRVAAGHSISSLKGDPLDANAEIGPADVGGQDRIDHLVEVGHIDQVDKTGDKPERDQKVEPPANQKTPEEQKVLDDAKALKK